MYISLLRLALSIKNFFSFMPEYSLLQKNYLIQKEIGKWLLRLYHCLWTFRTQSNNKELF